jgi:RimJ/RimL family protein N-acetyltransferase
VSNLSDPQSREAIPPETLKAFSRSVYKEARKYGFQQLDIVRLINKLMDLCSKGDADLSPGSESARDAQVSDIDCTRLPIVGPTVCVRAVSSAEDRAALESWLPDRHGRYFVLSCATAQSLSIDALMNTPENHLGIIAMPDGKRIGAMAYLDHSSTQQRAELRKLIGDPAYRGRGLAEEATRLWVNYGFQGLGLKKIFVSTLQTQVANIKLNEKIGFQVEGLLRNEVLIDGRRHDVLRMGMTFE